ncbi:MAG: sugar transferase [Solirubrobacterales bacterium]|nr:sugar transferase [Solirubrobacterales bacterium]
MADGVALMCSTAVAMALTGVSSYGAELAWTCLSLIGWYLLFTAYGLYERQEKRISHSTVDDIPQVFHAVILGALVLWPFLDFGPSGRVKVSTIYLFAMFALIGVVLARAIARSYVRWVFPAERVLILGKAQLSQILVRKMRAHPEYGLDPVAIVTGSLAEVCEFADLERLAALHRIDRIMLADTGADTNELLRLLSASRHLLLNVSIVPTVFEAMGPAIQVGDLEGVTVLGLNPPVLPRTARIVKRAIDIIGAGFILLMSSPLLMLIAVAIKRDSPGPVLFVQRRVGRGDRAFRIYKFRTMHDRAEEHREEVIANSEDPHWVKLQSDPRVTRVGALLRKTSLDELPQLWNVLVGDMSLVGPRPLPEAEDRQIEGWGRGRLDLTPGITGYWQVLGRTSIGFTEMVKLDYIYVTNWSLWTDIRLILRTLPVVLRARGVN